jgi:DHA1 family tetracycline resistance protein-like MFS transporter
MLRRTAGPNALVFVAITVLLDIIGFGIIIPVLPTLLIDLTGRSVSEAAIYGGWLAFLYAGIQFVCAPVLGNLSDRFGRRPVLLMSVGALGLDYLVMGFAPTLGWLFLGRAISGIAGASFTPAYAFVADVSPPEKRAQSFGMISAAFGIGFVLGPAIGGALGSFGPRAPFFAAAILSLCNFVYGYLVLPESLPTERRRPLDWKRANPLGTLLQVRKHPEVRGVLAALFLWMVAHQVMPATWPFYGKYRFDWSEATIGLSLAAAGSVMATSQLTLLRRIVPRLGERRAALLGIAVAGVGYVGYGMATAGWMMFAWLATWLFGALVMPSTNALLSHRVAANAQGELQGAVAGLYSLSAIVGPPLMTHIFAGTTGASGAVQLPGAVFFTAAGLAAACFLVYWRATGVANTAAVPVGAAHPRPAE